MRLFRLKPFTAPRHYIFTDPDKPEHTYQALSKVDLIKQIVAYRSQNELPPIEHLNLVLENYWANLPENADIAEVSPPLKRGFLAYLKGGVALLDFVFYGEKAMVSQPEADARADTCLLCPMNQFPDKGPFLQWADDMAEACVGDRKVSHYDDLGNCFACSCCLRAKVWYKGTFRLSENERKMMPDFCWQLHEWKKQNPTSEG